MSQLHWLSRLSRLGLEFWLPLPLVAGGIWGSSQWLNDRVLSRTSTTPAQLNANAKQQQQVSFALTLTILSIDAEIDRRSGTTEVAIQAGGSALKELEFEYPLTEFAEVEQAIARDFNLSPKAIRTLIRYRID